MGTMEHRRPLLHLLLAPAQTEMVRVEETVGAIVGMMEHRRPLHHLHLAPNVELDTRVPKAHVRCVRLANTKAHQVLMPAQIATQENTRQVAANRAPAVMQAHMQMLDMIDALDVPQVRDYRQ